MNVLFVNNTDFEGVIYNGHSLQKSLNECNNIRAKELVLYSNSRNINSNSFVNAHKLNIQHSLNEFEKETSMLNMLEPFGDSIKYTQEYLNADIVHFQLIHNHVISLQSIPALFNSKPSVWTIHDLWPFTGHCIHPLECEQWKTGCTDCEKLEDPFFELKYPKAGELWKAKKNIYKQIDPYIVVASDFVKRHLNESPLFSHFTNVTKIPFGIDVDSIKVCEKAAAKQKYDIPIDNVTVGFRLNDSKLKGVDLLVKALSNICLDNVTLLCVDAGNDHLLDSLRNKCRIVEMGFCDYEKMQAFYEAVDIFVMPSLAESFGMMAIEAMLHKCTTVVFEGTALTETTFAPNCGVAVPFMDVERLGETIYRLIKAPDERIIRGDLGRKLAQDNYRYEQYVRKHIDLYESIIANQNDEKKKYYEAKKIEIEKEAEESMHKAEKREKAISCFAKKMKEISGDSTGRISIYCAGAFAKKTYSLLNMYRIKVNYVADKSLEKQGVWDYDLECISIERLYKECKDDLIIVANKYPTQIVDELIGYGFKHVIDYYKLLEIEKAVKEKYKVGPYDDVASLDYSDEGVMKLVSQNNIIVESACRYYKNKLDSVTVANREPKEIKAIAMYLPQFHETPENNEWWGQGYTEWIAVKKAKALFDGHYQPREPLDNWYYDLMDEDTIARQVELAKEGNVYGFCYYHYWFKDGRRVLEKPAEQLLDRKELDIHYCFSWANESWVRTWSNVKGGNAWVDSGDDSKHKPDDNGILLDQQYGEEKDWEEHFNYLLPFFKDERYIKENGKPLFMIYRPELVDCLDEMLKFWKNLAVENGLPGLQILCANCEENKWEYVDARYIQEFNYSYNIDTAPIVSAVSWDKGVLTYDYDKLWENILKRPYELDEKVYLGACVNFDCTPRHGKKGNLTVGSTPEKYAFYFEKLCERSLRRNNEYVFINAWNEWGEGMHLEPDKKYGKAFLQATRDAISVANMKSEKLACEVDILSINDTNCKWQENNNNTSIPMEATQWMDSLHARWDKESQSRKYYEEKFVKFKDYFDLLDRWMKMREKQESVANHILEKGWNNIAIYGIGKLGYHLYKDLVDSEVEVICCIDRKMAGSDYEGMKVISPNESFSATVDAIIVTAISDYQEIKMLLEEKYACPIVSLQELIV